MLEMTADTYALLALWEKPPEPDNRPVLPASAAELADSVVEVCLESALLECLHDICSWCQSEGPESVCDSYPCPLLRLIPTVLFRDDLFSDEFCLHFQQASPPRKEIARCTYQALLLSHHRG
jgi:hypothetical protein